MSGPEFDLPHQQPMNEAIAALRRAGVNFVKKTGFQLKIGPFNYYPAKGTIYRDGETSARKQKGLPAFLRLLRDAGHTRADQPIAYSIDMTECRLELPSE